MHHVEVIIVISLSGFNVVVVCCYCCAGLCFVLLLSLAPTFLLYVDTVAKLKFTLLYSTRLVPCVV